MQGIFAVTDGERMSISTHTNSDLESVYWEEFIQAHEGLTTSYRTFVAKYYTPQSTFPASGKVVAASGMCHTKLSDEMTPFVFEFLKDSAFQRCVVEGKIVRARKRTRWEEKSAFPKAFNYQIQIYCSIDPCRQNERASSGESGK